MTPRSDLDACRASLREGSRTFLAASWLLPRAVRDSACALYAFCRLADDAVDGARDDVSRARAVQALRLRLDDIYREQPSDHPADRALARVVRRHGLARALPDALIEGFAWDAEERSYETLPELQAYAARVAGSVGAMMAVLMGVRSATGLARACDLGVAMQLSNIARDVGEDARMGRLYLPRAWMREAGLDPAAWLRAPAHSAALASVVRRVLDEADRLYDRVGDGVSQLPLGCRPGINAARRLYAEIGHEVARRGLDAVTQRAVVGSGRKARVLVAALTEAAWPSSRCVDGPLDATRYLVEAAVDGAFTGAMPGRQAPSWNPATRAAWTIELFTRLERRDREALPHRGLAWSSARRDGGGEVAT